MSFTTATLKKWLTLITALVLFSALLASLLMTSDALQSSARFEHLYTLLLVINITALFALFTLISLNFRELVQRVRGRKIGARLTVRLVSLLIILSTTPVIIVYVFSLQFLNQRLDSWFDVNIDQALTDALDLSREAFDSRLREALKQTEALAREMTLEDDNLITLQLNELRYRSGAFELTLLTSRGKIIASSSVDTEHLLPLRLEDNVLMQFRRNTSYVSLKPVFEQGLHVQVVVKLTRNRQDYLLQALFPVASRSQELANSIETAYNEYKERAYLHKPLKLSFTLVLSLVLLLSIFGAMWMAFFAARRLVAPLNDLAEGTRAVASGDYDKQLPITYFDELGFLVQSFNTMTRKIAQARAEVEQSQQIAESQRAYFQAVLERLSSGVISLDQQHCLRTANLAAEQILEIPLTEFLGQCLFQHQNDYPALKALYQAFSAHLNQEAQDWREEITLFGTAGRKMLLCRGKQLQPIHEIQQQGYIIVFDDVTTLIQAQRDAAWSEVARRLAHEIKNPLTPIQLSAERLRQKYLDDLPPDKVSTLDRMTRTIIHQVEAMKEMVNAFSNYAKTPTMHWQPIDLNKLIKEIVDLYQDHQASIQLSLQELPLIEADTGRLRQILHNLLKNAQEASPPMGEIMITTHYLTNLSCNCVELHIQDQGSGVPTELFDKIFEPYVTTKTKGTGLGLAIVRKIVEEHGGIVWIENNTGACIKIRLPVNPIPSSKKEQKMESVS